MQSDIDWRSVDPFSGRNLKIWYLCAVNAQKKWVAKFSNFLDPVQDKSEGKLDVFFFPLSLF